MNRFQKNRHRRDGNHAAIVKHLVFMGCSVRDLSQVGDNGPDLLVGVMGRDYQMEIKSQGKVLTGEQEEWHEAWRGVAPVTVWTLEQAEAWVNHVRRLK